VRGLKDVSNFSMALETSEHCRFATQRATVAGSDVRRSANLSDLGCRFDFGHSEDGVSSLFRAGRHISKGPSIPKSAMMRLAFWYLGFQQTCSVTFF